LYKYRAVEGYLIEVYPIVVYLIGKGAVEVWSIPLNLCRSTVCPVSVVNIRGNKTHIQSGSQSCTLTAKQQHSEVHGKACRETNGPQACKAQICRGTGMQAPDMHRHKHAGPYIHAQAQEFRP
jgi:hypothetical protein